MRTDCRTIAALNTGIGLPNRDVFRDTPFFVLRGAGRVGPVVGEHGDRNLVASTGHDLSGNILHELRCIIGNKLFHFGVASGLCRVIDLLHARAGQIDGGHVPVDHILSLLAVGGDDRVLDKLERLFLFENS